VAGSHPSQRLSTWQHSTERDHFGTVHGILAFAGITSNRFVGFGVSIVVMTATWKRYTRHHYKSQYRPENRG